MPKTKLCESVARASEERLLSRQNHIEDLFRYLMREKHMTLETVGSQIGCAASSVSYRLSRPASAWTIGELQQMCSIFGISLQAALDAASRCDLKGSDKHNY